MLFLLLIPATFASNLDRGRGLFEHRWTPQDPLARGGDGLGPLYNATSCVACHSVGGVGGAGGVDERVELLPHHGVLHAHSTEEGYPAWRTFRVEGLGFQQACGVCTMHAQVPPTSHLRIAPSLFGTGQLNGVSEADLDAAARAGEAKGVSGRIARDAEGRPGRFGWRAQTSTLSAFVEEACASELGLSTPSRRQAPNPVAERSDAVSVTDLDQDQVDALTAFVASLPPPPTPTAKAKAGRRAFDEVGCTACHMRQLGPVSGAYTDLLLHDMGPGLMDGTHYGALTVAEFAAQASEWRTAPLWGVADTGPYLHDGRAPTLRAAIEHHGGEAAASVEAFVALPEDRREALLAFLGSLKLASGEPHQPLGRTNRKPASP